MKFWDCICASLAVWPCSAELSQENWKYSFEVVLLFSTHFYNIKGGGRQRIANKLRLKLCQAQIKLKVEARFVAKSVEVEIEADLVLKSCILYFCGRVGGLVGGGGVWWYGEVEIKAISASK